MILKKAHITKFKCINDSTNFALEDDVTCLVGKNEAGKTAILEALYKLKPVNDKDSKFDYVREYFKPEMLDYERVHEKSPAPVVSVIWKLEEEDHKALEAVIGAAAARKIVTVTTTKRWNNKVYVDIPLGEAEIIQDLLKTSDIEAKDRPKFKAANTVQELITQLSATPEEQQQRAALIQSIKDRFGSKTALESVKELIWKRVPRFAFFSQYLRMPGQLAVDHFKQRVAAGQQTDEDKVFTSLLELIGMSVEA